MKLKMYNFTLPSILRPTRNQYRCANAEDCRALFPPLCTSVGKWLNERCAKSDEFWSNSDTDLLWAGV